MDEIIRDWEQPIYPEWKEGDWAIGYLFNAVQGVYDRACGRVELREGHTPALRCHFWMTVKYPSGDDKTLSGGG